MARLPQPGGDNGNWGSILNDYLSQSHKSDGTIKDNVVTAAALAPDSVDATAIANGTITEALLTTAVQAKLNTSVTNATATVPGKIQLTGDLAGSATSPTVPGLSNKVSKGELLFNVLDYGAKNNSTLPTQTTAAINAAITAAIAVHGEVYFPAGFYVVNGPLSITSGIKLRGANKKITSIGWDVNSNCDGVVIDDGVTGFVISDLTLFGNKNNNTSGRGIVFTGSLASTYQYHTSGVISDVMVTDWAQDNVYVGKYRHAGIFTNLSSTGSNGCGLYIDEAQDTFVSNPSLGSNASYGLRINETNTTVIGGNIYGNLVNVYYDTRNAKSLMSGTVIESSRREQIIISATSLPIQHVFTGISLGKTGTDASGTYTAIKSATVNGLSISGQYYYASGDARPNYLFDVPSLAAIVLSGFQYVSSAWLVSFSKNGTSGFVAGEDTATSLRAAGAAPMISGLWYAQQSTGTSTSTPGADGSLKFARIVPAKACVINNIGIEITAAGSAGAVVRLGLYSYDPLTGSVALILDAGTVDATATGFKSLSISQAVSAGQHLLLAAANQGGATTRPTMRTSTGSDSLISTSTALTISQAVLLGLQTTATGAFPSTPAISVTGS